MQRVKNFKLDTALRDACEDDLKDQCSVSLKDMDDSDSVKRMGLNCLQQYKEELKSDTCRAEVHRRMKVGARYGPAPAPEDLISACFPTQRGCPHFPLTGCIYPQQHPHASLPPPPLPDHPHPQLRSL